MLENPPQETTIFFKMIFFKRTCNQTAVIYQQVLLTANFKTSSQIVKG